MTRQTSFCLIHSRATITQYGHQTHFLSLRFTFTSTLNLHSTHPPFIHPPIHPSTHSSLSHSITHLSPTHLKLLPAALALPCIPNLSLLSYSIHLHHTILPLNSFLILPPASLTPIATSIPVDPINKQLTSFLRLRLRPPHYIRPFTETGIIEIPNRIAFYRITSHRGKLERN